MRKLLFDISIEGHHTEYISHLVDYFYDSRLLQQDEYFFILNAEFKEKFSSIALKASKCSNISLLYLSEKELKNCENGNIIKKSFTNYHVMNSYAKKLEVDHVILLNFNPFQLAFVFFKPLYAVSGILFLQFYRMSKENWKSKLKYYKKYYLSKFYSNNRSLKNVFILNDQKSVNFLNSEFCSSIFRVLKDPIPELSPLEDFCIYKHYSIEENRKIFLHIGALGDRKGTFDIIESVNHLDDEIKQKVAILLVGKPESEIAKKRMLNSISSHNKHSGQVLFYDFNFISNQKMKSIFDQCYSVLIPYKNSEASSGILGHSIAAKKPVIATGSGLLKEIIEANNLGSLIKEDIVISLARTIEKFVQNEAIYASFKGSDKFIKSHRPITFVEKIIEISNDK